MRNWWLLGGPLLVAVVLAGCVGPQTFTIEGSWFFVTSAQGAVWAAPCDYPSGPITVSDTDGNVLATATVRSTAYGYLAPDVICNVYFEFRAVPADVDRFMFSVPGFDDPHRYSRDELKYLRIGAR